MSWRAKKMVDLARQKQKTDAIDLSVATVSKNQCNILNRRINDTYSDENEPPTKYYNQNTYYQHGFRDKKAIIDGTSTSSSILQRCDQFFLYTNFEPSVKNETATSIHEIPFYNNILKERFQPSNNSVDTQNVNEIDDDIEEFDDSVEDPNYQYSVSSDSDSDSGNDMDLEIPQMANQIELELNQDEPSVSKKDSFKQKQQKRNRGESYTNKSEKIVDSRKCIPLEKCHKDCKSKIHYDEQLTIFEHYWNLGTYNQRILHVASFIEIKDKKTQTMDKSIVAPRNRLHTICYNIELHGKKIPVCQICFRKCFGETESFLKSVVKKKISSPITEFCDNRGRSQPPHKLNEEQITAVQNNINGFPAYESHYTRRDTSKKYFHADLTLSKMYSLYCQENSRPVSLTKYSEIFKGIDIKFKSPQYIYTCSKCDTFKAKIDMAIKDSREYVQLKQEQEIHHLEADLAYKCKERDKVLSKNCENMKTFAFDLQQCLPTPFLKSNDSFYKRQLWTYNLTIHDCGTDDSFCYMWYETVAKRGGNDIASCVLKHLKTFANQPLVKKLCFYSDSCTGQNKNSFVAAMFLTFIENNETIETIDHKFLVPGHTHMECDTDHAAIERKKKKTSVKIHHPRDWFQFVRSVGTKKKFKVIEMEQTDFFEFSNTVKTKFMWRTNNESSEKFVWKDVKWLRYTKENFGIIYYKTTLDEEEPFKSLNLRRRGINTIKDSDLNNAYAEPVLISKEKKSDLVSLLPQVDVCFHDFYKNLPSSAMIINIHPDLVEDDEIEI